MIGNQVITAKPRPGQPQETYSHEDIEEMLRKNKQDFKEIDSNNMSMDDEDLDAEIGTIDSQIQDVGDDPQALTKLEKSKGLLNQRKSLFEILKSIQYPPLNSEAQLLSQAERMKKELIQFESCFAKDWGLELSQNLISEEFSASLQTQLSEELLQEYLEKINSLKNMRDSVLELLAEVDIEPSIHLLDDVKKELQEVRVSIQSLQAWKLQREIERKQAAESHLQKILQILEDIQQLFGKIEVINPDPGDEIPEQQSSDVDDSEFFNIINEMKYYSDLPEGCFEKKLTQVLCALYLKTGDATQTQKSQLKQYLDKDLLEANNYDSIICNGILSLIKLREQENIENKLIINLLKELNDLKKPIPNEKLLVIKKEQHFWRILTEKRKFHFSLFYDYCDQVIQVADKLQGMDIVFLLGTTGCGKSTTIQYLCGSEMYKTKVNGLHHIGFTNIQNEELKEVKTSPSARSETRFVKLIKIQQKNERINLVDSAGLFDTKSPEIDVSNQIGIVEAFCRAKTAKPVIILSLKNFGDRGEGFKAIMIFYASMLQDLERLNQFFFLFSHVKGHTQETLRVYFQELYDTECNSPKKEPIVIQFIDTIITKFDVGEVCFIDPLDPTKIEHILKKITKSKPINQPKQVFQKSIQESSRICINEQIQIHQEEILHAIQTFRNENYALFKLEQLQRFAKDFNQYQEYNECIIKISTIFSKEFKKICTQIQTALKKENNLTNSDINDIKQTYQFLIMFENLRTKFLNQGENNLKVQSANSIIDFIEQQAYANRLMLDSEQGSIKLDSEIFHKYFEKLEYLSRTGYEKLIGVRDQIHIEFINRLKDDKSKMIAKIKKFISVDNNEQRNYEKNDQDKFFHELSTFFAQLEKGIQINQIDKLRNSMEDVLNNINSAIEKQFHTIQSEQLDTIYSESLKTENDFSVLQCKSLEQLENELTFSMTGDLMKTIKQYYEILNKFSLSLRNSSKFNLYLATDQRKKQLVRHLAYWFFVKEEIIRKRIEDVKEVKKNYLQVKILYDAGIVNAEISGRYNRLQNNLNALVEKKIDQIKTITETLSQGIQITQHQGMNHQPVSEYNLVSLREAVRTIKELDWTMNDSKQEYLSSIEQPLKESLERLIESIQDEINDLKLEIENIEDFRNISKAFKLVGQISRIAKELNGNLKINFQNNFGPQIEDSLKQIEKFINKKKITVSEEEKSGQQIKQIQQYQVLQKTDCKKLSDYHTYLKTLNQNDDLINAIQNFSKSYPEEKKQESSSIELDSSMNLRQQIKQLYQQAEQLINDQEDLILKEINNNIAQIKQYVDGSPINQKSEELKLDDNEEDEIDKIQKCLINPINSIIQKFNLINHLKSSQIGLWDKIDQSTSIDDHLKGQISQLNLDLNTRIQIAPNSAINAPKFQRYLTVIYYLLPLAKHVGDQNNSFENSYKQSLEKVTKLNVDVLEQAKIYLQSSEYEEILNMLKVLESLKNPQSQENINKILKDVKIRVKNLYNQIENISKNINSSSNKQTKKLQEDQQISALNQAVQELSSIVNEKKWHEYIGDSTIESATKVLDKLDRKLIDDYEYYSKQIEDYIECTQFYDADQLIKKQISVFKFIEFSDKNTKYTEAFTQLKKMKDLLFDKMSKIHLLFKLNNEEKKQFVDLRNKKAAEIYKNLQAKGTNYEGNLHQKYPPNDQNHKFIQAQQQIIDVLRQVMKDRIQYLNTIMESDHFKEELDATFSVLDTFPELIIKEYKTKLDDEIQKIYEKKVNNERDGLSKACNDDQSLDAVKKIIKSLNYGVQSSQKELLEYFKRQCKEASHLLKTNIISFFDKYLIPIWDFVQIERLQSMIGFLLSEILKFKDEVMKAFNRAVEYILISLLSDGDNPDQQPDEYQKMDDDLAAKLFFKMLELYKANIQPGLFSNDQIEKILVGFLIITNSKLEDCLQELEEAYNERNWKEFFELVQKFKTNDRYSNLLLDQNAEAFYKTKPTINGQNISEVYNDFNENLQKTRFREIYSEQILPKVRSAQDFFDNNFRLMNRQTQNQIAERNRFYLTTNDHYLIIKYSAKVIQEQPEMHQRNLLNDINTIFMAEVQDIIINAKAIAQDLKRLNFPAYKQLDDYLANLEVIQRYPDLANISPELNKNFLQIKIDLNEKINISINRAKSEIEYEKAIDKVDTKIVVLELVFLQKLSSIQLIKEPSVQGIKSTIEMMTYVQKELQKNQSTKDKANFIVQLAQDLQHDDQGDHIVQQYNLFEGIKRRIEAELKKKQGVEYVLKNLKFFDGAKIENVSGEEQKELKDKFDQYNEIYMELLKKYLGSQERIQENLLALKFHLQNLVNIGNGPLTVGAIDNIPSILAHLFAIFTIQDSEVFHQNQEDGNIEQGDCFLLKPHAGQIIAIFRLLGVGHSEIKQKIYQYDEQKKAQIQKLGKNKQFMFDNLAQIKTGEGKSYVLGIITSIFALWGFNVSCASYSEYLSSRDLKSFQRFFSFLGIQDYISYSSFTQNCEQFINSNGDIRKMVVQKIMKEPQNFIKKIEEDNKLRNIEGFKFPDRPQVLLIDEVDVFFSENFFGRMFSPTLNIKCTEVSELLDHVWSLRDTKKKFKLADIQESQQYKDCLALFNQPYEQLFKASCKQMLDEVKSYKDHGYNVVGQKIGYLYQDQYSFSINYGYKTKFAHYHEQKRILPEYLENCKSIPLQIGQFSYSEIPIKFALTLGVTGTLDALSSCEIEIVKETFQIQNFSYIPSVYGNSNLIWERRAKKVQVFNNDFYYNEIINEVNANLVNHGSLNPSQSNRAVLIFFKSEKKIDAFRESSGVGDNFKHMTLTEKIEDLNEKERIVLLATQPGAITLATPNFGRGTDFICRNKEVEANGGLHVILTFMCTQKSEFVQIQGRTARQGNQGSFQMVLLDEDLKDFDISLLDTNHRNYESYQNFTDQDLLRFLEQKRDERFSAKKKTELEGIKTIKRQHDAGIQFQKYLLGLAQEQEILKYLLSINPYRSECNEIKTLVLMDATGSMSDLIQKVKNSVCTMFEQTSQILANRNLSPDLIRIQFAVYKNYNVQPDQLLQHSGWESNPMQLRSFMETISAGGGIAQEAVEVGLRHANFEANNDDDTPLRQVFLIGDAPANPVETVIARRTDYGIKWEGSKFEEAVFWDKEAQKLAEKGIPVQAFYVDDDWAKPNFDEIARITGGTSQFLDVNNELLGQKILTDKFSQSILFKIGELTKGKEFAETLVQDYADRFA